MNLYTRFDLAVIGGGSAGLVVAAAAAQFGEKVVLFEKAAMGGECLNTGCVPSKALLAAAKAHMPFGEAMAHVQSVIAKIAPFDSQERFEGLGVTVVRAEARFVGEQQLEADGTIYTARRIIVATGSRAAIPPIPGLADVPYFTNETIFTNRESPSHLVVIGGGPIGLEMAQAHWRLGSRVTVIEAMRPLGRDDPELARIVLDALRDDGVDIIIGLQAKQVSKIASGVRIELADGRVIDGSHLLVAAGRKANVEGLNLEAAGIAFDRNGITVDHGLRTSNRRVYAAGDVATPPGGPLQFTHVAGYQAGLIVRNALFRLPVKLRRETVPWVTYTDPELAHVGLSETQAREQHGNSVRVLRWSFGENDRAQADGKTRGMVKIIVGRRGVVLGADIVGAQAGELIAMWALAVSKGLTISAIANLVLPYPTLGEAGKRAAITYYSEFPRKAWLRRAIGLLKRLG